MATKTRSAFLVTCVIALLGVGLGAVRAEHLPPDQQSPCRPNPPAGEQIAGYSDDGPQDDPQRELPTIYYNTAESSGAYIGVCAGGSAGEPIRYAEIRLTPGGPYVYGSDAAGGQSFGGCTPAEDDPTVPFAWAITGHCAVVSMDSGDARDLSGDVSATGPWYFDPRYFFSEEPYTGENDRFEINARQDGVTLTRHVDATYYDYYSGEYTVTTSEQYFVTRTSDGKVSLGRSTSDGCMITANDDLTDSAPPTYTESGPAGCPRPVATAQAVADAVPALIDAVGNALDAVGDEAPPAPSVPPGAAACRPSPEPGEQSLPVTDDGPALAYFNTASAQPYAGVCVGGTDGEAVRFVELRQTPAGPYIYQSDGSAGHTVDEKCVERPLIFFEDSDSFCASAKVTSSDTSAAAARKVTYQYNEGYETGAEVSQDGVTAFDRYYYYGFTEGNTYFVRRDPSGQLYIGTYSYGAGCERGLVLDLQSPGPPSLYSTDPVYCPTGL